ncbi:MAG: hypothetical protein IT381_12380 [Deltaproteobacteria bacterium]|nr:hypothetical protein [Deltaproteobacteria bacterium]
MLFLLLLAAAHSKAAPPPPIRELNPPPFGKAYPTIIQTDVFDVIDVDWKKQLVAFRHIYRLSERDPAGVDDEGNALAHADGTALKRCAYPGMSDTPYAGLIVGVYDIGNDKLKGAFQIYESTRGECTSEEKAAEQKRSAEQVLKSFGLGPSSRAQVLKLPPPKDGVQSFVLRSKAKSYELTATNVRHAADDPPTVCGNEAMVTAGIVKYGAMTVWVRCQRDRYRSASGGAFTYPLAVIGDGRLLLVEKFHHSSFETDVPTREMWSFSRILKLK